MATPFLVIRSTFATCTRPPLLQPSHATEHTPQKWKPPTIPHSQRVLLYRSAPLHPTQHVPEQQARGLGFAPQWGIPHPHATCTLRTPCCTHNTQITKKPTHAQNQLTRHVSATVKPSLSNMSASVKPFLCKVTSLHKHRTIAPKVGSPQAVA